MKPRDSYQRTNKNKLLSPSAKVFFAKMFGWVDPPKFLTAKVLCYTVYTGIMIIDAVMYEILKVTKCSGILQNFRHFHVS